MTEEPNSPPRFMVRGQYVKDLSFENPHAPQTLMKPEEKPKIEINVGLKAQKLSDDHYELVLHLAGQAHGAENVLFVVEIAYGAIIQMVNIPEDKIEPVLFIDCATVLFPFARRVLADVTRDGGFQAMLLEPMDFAALYVYNKNNPPRVADAAVAQA
jgi:preprotein translocase subunit SecB